MAARNARTLRADRGQPLQGGRQLRVGDLLAGKYRVERVLGEGGMGVVVAAYHELLDQRVAVKLLFHDVADREAQSRLLLEARAAAKIQSDHVARVVDVDTGADGLPFIVMELLEGADLCAIADAQGALPRWVVVDYVLQALEGLAHAHVRGIVHRDLKPSNLFLASRADGTQILKILDFGISKTSSEAEPSANRRGRELTGGRAVLGSPPYMSPEQVRSPKSVDHRTDIWALGVVMYELLTNSMPFGGEEMQETFANILEHDPMPVEKLASGVPEGLARVVHRCLAKQREDRFADVGELARALVPYGSGSWASAADRIAATLARGAPDDPHGAMRARVPSSGRALQSRSELPSELHGTASTVTDSVLRASAQRRRFVALAIVAPAALGVLIGGAALMRARTLKKQLAEPVPAVAAPPAPAVDVAPAVAPTPTASESPPPAAAPAVAAESPKPSAASSAKRPSTTSPRKAAAGVAPKSALPAGLPMTRE